MFSVDQADEPKGTAGIEYMVPMLGGVGREGVTAELPALLQVRESEMKLTLETETCVSLQAEKYVRRKIRGSERAAVDRAG